MPVGLFGAPKPAGMPAHRRRRHVAHRRCPHDCGGAPNSLGSRRYRCAVAAGADPVMAPCPQSGGTGAGGGWCYGARAPLPVGGAASRHRCRRGAEVRAPGCAAVRRGACCAVLPAAAGAGPRRVRVGATAAAGPRPGSCWCSRRRGLIELASDLVLDGLQVGLLVRIDACVAGHPVKRPAGILRIQDFLALTDDAEGTICGSLVGLSLAVGDSLGDLSNFISGLSFDFKISLIF